MYFGRPLPVQRAGVIDPMAFSATGRRAPKARFDERGVKYDLRQQVGAGTCRLARGPWQLFCVDPYGAEVELDVDASETL